MIKQPSSFARTRARVTCVVAVTVFSLGLLAAAPRQSQAAELLLKKGDRVAVVGDSITQQKQYSKFIELYLLACVPQLDLTVYQFGRGAETARGFQVRMENDMVPWRPTVVTTCYGMNDGGYRPYAAWIGRNYETSTRRIQGRCKELGMRMVVGGPGAVDTTSWKPDQPDADRFYNDNLGKLSDIAGRLAAENGFVYANLHNLMMKVMADAKAAFGDEYIVCGRDGVHPVANGHLVMAYAFLKAMGLDGDIGTITVDLNGKTTATEGHRVVSAKDGTVKLESTRYPFCFYGGEQDPNGTRSILRFLPFNRDLNRLTLLVKNLPAPAADVAWGNAKQTFTREQLEAGVNLADAFIENPFCESFGQLNDIVANKQNRETHTILGFIPHFRSLANGFPGDTEVAKAIDTLRTKLFDRNAADAASARAAVKPVTHTIMIAPAAQE